MSHHHILKTDPDVFEAVCTGAKTFEIRFNDRSFAVGDTLHLRETASTGAAMQAGAALVYTGRAVLRTVSHVLTGYGLADGWCCLSFDQPAAIADAEKTKHLDAWRRAGEQAFADGQADIPPAGLTFHEDHEWHLGWMAAREAKRAKGESVTRSEAGKGAGKTLAKYRTTPRPASPGPGVA